MKLTIERAALLKSLSHVQSIVERRNTIPILANVLLEAKGDRLSLTASDLDMEVVESVSAQVGRDGATTVPAHTMHDIVRKLPDGAQVELDFSTSDQRLTLTAGTATFTLACLPREDFPAMPLGDLPHRFAMPADGLARMIDKTRFAISNEETRYYLNGIFLHVPDASTGTNEPVLRAVATDGHRLARYQIEAPDGAMGMPGIILPKKAVGELRKLIEEADGPIDVALSDSKIRFAFGDVVLTTKLIDGTFPDYARVIPANNDKVLEVAGRTLSEAVDRVSTISTEKSRAVKLNLSDGRMILTVINPDSGNAKEELSVDYGSSDLEIGFNAKYLMDITAQLDSDKARILLAESGSPTVVHDGTDDRGLYVLMPMRV